MKTWRNVKSLAKELGVSRQLLYLWKQQADGRRKTTGASKTEDPEDPRERRICELEREVGELKGVIGEKTLEVDFFADALRRVKESRQRKGKSGVTASTPESAGGCKRKVD
jgi:transposase-like protein